jgi:hypothetical protein
MEAIEISGAQFVPLAATISTRPTVRRKSLAGRPAAASSSFSDACGTGEIVLIRIHVL